MKTFAFVFPGQGSQSVGMLDAWGDHPAVRATLEEAAQALGEDVGLLIKACPKEALDLTTNTQPVMLTAAIACYNAWRAEGGAEPAAVAGHSLGEYSALVAAGALTLADALPLVRLRAQAMQRAVPVGAGAMAAVSITGWVLVVSSSASFGPPWISAPMSSLSAAEASASVCRTAGCSPQASSMPTDCEPWPGKTNANAGMDGLACIRWESPGQTCGRNQ